MTWIKKNNVSVLILILLLLTVYLPTYFSWGLSIGVIFICIIKNKGKLVISKIPGKIFYILLISTGCLVGILNMSVNGATMWMLIRDFIYTTTFFVYWSMSAQIGYKMKYNKDVMYNTILLFCVIYSLIFIIQRMLTIFTEGTSLISFYDFASSAKIEEYVLAIGVFLAFFKDREYFFNKKVEWVIKGILIVAFVGAVSRTAILVFACLLIVNLGKKWKKIFGFALIGVIFIAFFYSIFPEVFQQFIYKIMRSLTEVSASSSWTSTEIVQNWRGYENYTAKRMFDNFNILEYFVGRGFGYLLSVGSYASLVTGEGGLATLHNGYYTMLIKEGMVGIGLNLCFYVSLFIKSISYKHDQYSRNILVGIVISIIISTLFINGIIWSGARLIIAFLLSWTMEESYGY